MARQKFALNFLLIFLSYSISVLADEVNIQVNLKHPVNVVSDKYVSFSIDPNVLLENINSTDSELSDFMAKQLKPSYLKISGNSFFTLLSALSNAESVEELKDNVAQSVWRNFNKWIRSVDWLPIVPLPYNPKKWDSIHALRVLNISNSLGVKDCIWQLGIDFDPTDAPRYVDDLTTLKNVVDAFDDSPNHWGVIGADISPGSSRDETRLYVDLAHEVVEAIGWVQPAEYTSYENQNNIIDDRDLALRAILSRDLPAWLTIPPKMLKNSKNVANCSALCITEGLQWAQILGDAARTGFNVVFKPLDKSDLREPGFSFFISWLFKKTMGEEVFDTKIMSGDRYISHFYSHCTKDLSGAITIMGINMGDMPSKITAKLSNKYSGPELWQYILTVSEGTVKLNGENVRMNSTFEPLVKIKHPSKPTTLVLPPLSIGFWILPSANHRECLKEDMPDKNSRVYNDYEYDRNGRLITSSDRLLQQLIKENIAKSNQPISNRLKRHIVVKKDSNYLNQLVKDVDRQTYNQYTKPNGLARQKRFILKNQNRPRLFQNLFESAGLGGAGGLGGLGGAGGLGGLGNLGILGGLGGDRAIAAPAPPPPPPPPPQIETQVEDNRRFKRVFPRLPFMKLEQLFQNRKTRRAKRQALNLFKRGPFSNAGKENRPKLFPGFRNMMAPADKTIPDKRMPNEEEILAPRKDIQFPEGDVHINLTKIPDADYDYVEFDATQPRKFVNVPADNIAFRQAPNTFHDTFSITEVVPRVEKPFVSQSIHQGKRESGVALHNTQLELVRKQLESYYMPAPPGKSSTEDFTKGKSDEELGTPVQTRKRRSAVLKSLSWALSQGDKHLSNIIEREEAEQANSMPIFERVRPFLRLQKYDRSAKPRSLEELQAASAEGAGNLVNEEDATTNMPDMELNDDGPELAKIRIIAEAPGSNPQTPKFMNYLTNKLNRFMDMVNSHVTGWWNTWV